MILKRNRLGIAVALAAVLALASCSQDELADGDNMLPDGQYPLEIASATLAVEGSEQPWTKVGENVDGTGSEFTANDAITVSLGSETAAYTYDGSAWTSTAPLYWQNTQQATVNAWYPTAENVSLADQSEGLAYVLKGSGTGSYQSGVNLTFTHQLAKVRVVLSGSQADQVTEVGIKSYTSCTHNQGTVSTDGASEDWITMQKVTYNGTECWEANVVPGHTITQFKVNNTVGTLDGSGVTPVAASLHPINLTIGNKVLTGGETVTEPGDYTISGNITEGITINGDGITVTLDGATITTSGIGINVQSGSPTIKVSGTGNSVTSSTATAIHVNGGTTLTIEGVNGTEDKLTTTGGKVDGTALGSENAGAGAGIGSSNGGNIVISNVTIEATGGTWNHYSGQTNGGSAAIGSTVPGYCGDITITDAVVNATGGYMAAAIGMGGSLSDSYSPDLKIGEIDIRNSVITATGGFGASAIGFASTNDMFLSSAYAGEIYIETTTETSSAFLSRLTISNGNYKIGKGSYYTGRMTFYNQDGSGTWPGVTLKARDGTQTSADGIGQ